MSCLIVVRVHLVSQLRATPRRRTLTTFHYPPLDAILVPSVSLILRRVMIFGCFLARASTVFISIAWIRGSLNFQALVPFVGTTSWRLSICSRVSRMTLIKTFDGQRIRGRFHIPRPEIGFHDTYDLQTGEGTAETKNLIQLIRTCPLRPQPRCILSSVIILIILRVYARDNGASFLFVLSY